MKKFDSIQAFAKEVNTEEKHLLNKTEERLFHDRKDSLKKYFSEILDQYSFPYQIVGVNVEGSKSKLPAIVDKANNPNIILVGEYDEGRISKPRYLRTCVPCPECGKLVKAKNIIKCATDVAEAISTTYTKKMLLNHSCKSALSRPEWQKVCGNTFRLKTSKGWIVATTLRVKDKQPVAISTIFVPDVDHAWRI